MASDPAPGAREARLRAASVGDGAGAPVPGDIRASRPYLLSRATLATVARRTASTCTLIALDLLGLTAGLFAALTLREYWVGHTPPHWGQVWDTESEWLPFLSLVMVLVFWRGGLYRRREVRAGIGRVLSSLTLVALLALAFAIGTGFEFTTYGVVPATLLFAWLLVGLLRAVYDGVTAAIMRRAGVRRRVLLVGKGAEVARLGRALGRSQTGIDYALMGAVTPAADAGAVPVLGDLPQLPELLAEQRLDELIVSDAGMSSRELLDVVDAAHRAGLRVRVAPTTTELLAERAEYVPGQGIPLFELRPPVFQGVDWLAKRSFDVVVSVALLVLGAPVWGAIALAIKLDSRGPVLYRDRRVGLDEHEFEMLKFRTMEVDAAERRAELTHRNEAGGALFKIRDDPRVTTVGRFLRRLSLDEIPQLWNVLRGEMSLVGPRPLPVRDYARLEGWHRKRSLVLPGMTGLWQISGRSELSFDDLVNLDFYYLEQWSVWLDVTILLKTIPAVASGRGAY